LKIQKNVLTKALNSIYKYNTNSSIINRGVKMKNLIINKLLINELLIKFLLTYSYIMSSMNNYNYIYLKSKLNEKKSPLIF
jgi:hypothetical protein